MSTRSRKSRDTVPLQTKWWALTRQGALSICCSEQELSVNEKPRPGSVDRVPVCNSCLFLPWSPSPCSVWAGDLLTSVLYTTIYRKEGTGVPYLITGALAYKTLGPQKLYVYLGETREVDYKLFSTFWSPCFSVKNVYNYGHWGIGMSKGSRLFGRTNSFHIFLMERYTTEKETEGGRGYLWLYAWTPNKMSLSTLR